MRKFLPVILFLLLALLLGSYLTSGRNPQDIPSALINQPAPDFDLPAVAEDGGGFSRADLGNGQVAVVNMFASWCAPCRAEHPMLMELRKSVPVYGIAYKDSPEQLRAMLAEMGNPYTKIGNDYNGRAAIEWGSYGVPETYVIDRDGRIVYKNIGPLTRERLDKVILPLIENLRK